MNRRTCFNCQSTWYSLADDELESPHTCPRCGDQLAPIAQAEIRGRTSETQGGAAAQAPTS
ncbi:MAG TPA: hypothetical protein VMD09_01475 [Solirubrobacteraceae bacterium]|nr:hypothetical protein [Solirubrobacteraceae bacterium]